MSIISSIYAEQANEIIVVWKKLIREAFEQKDWHKIEQLMEKMEKFEFYE